MDSVHTMQEQQATLLYSPTWVKHQIVSRKLHSVNAAPKEGQVKRPDSDPGIPLLHFRIYVKKVPVSLKKDQEECRRSSERVHSCSLQTVKYGSTGGRHMTPPLGPAQISGIPSLQFLGKIRQIVGWLPPPLRVGAFPSGKILDPPLLLKNQIFVNVIWF